MNKVGRRLAGIPAGSWTKWLVVGFWVVIFAVAYPLAGKLGHAEKNDASAWLPASAESVKVLDVQSRFQSPNIYSAVVVYHRAPWLPTLTGTMVCIAVPSADPIGPATWPGSTPPSAANRRASAAALARSAAVRPEAR